MFSTFTEQELNAIYLSLKIAKFGKKLPACMAAGLDDATPSAINKRTT